jgi:alpha-glucosidase
MARWQPSRRGRRLAALMAAAIWSLPAGGQVVAPVEKLSPPEEGFYSKRMVIHGVPILAHADVSDAALEEAARRIDRQIGRSRGIADNLRRLGARMYVIGKDQQTSDLPMYRHMKGKPFDGKATIDERGRGYGGLYASCSEENLLLLPSDRFREHRDICVHEFAHTILSFGASREVYRKVEQQWKKSLAAGKWKTMYAAKNPQEFFAELTMWYFGSRGDYGKCQPAPTKGALWLRSYDAEAYELIDSIYSGRLGRGQGPLQGRPAGHRGDLHQPV